MIFERKLASDEEELEEDDAWKVLISLSWSAVAFETNAESWAVVIVGQEEGAERGGIAVYHCDMGWKMKLDLELEMWGIRAAMIFLKEASSSHDSHPVLDKTVLCVAYWYSLGRTT